MIIAMYIRKMKIPFLSFLVIVSIMFFSCTSDRTDDLIAKIEQEQKPVDYKSLQLHQDLENVYGKVNLTEMPDSDSQFFIPSRKEKIVGFSCVECHTKPLEALKTEKQGKSAHWDIQLIHSRPDVLNCATCHNMERPNFLSSQTKKLIDYNQSYQLCAQCHSTQYNDWQGGAHGKRVEQWASPRLSLSCVECHNPHQPAIKKRWPSRLNTSAKD